MKLTGVINRGIQGEVHMFVPGQGGECEVKVFRELEPRTVLVSFYIIQLINLWCLS